MGDGKWVKMVENGQQRVTIQMCHIPNAQEAKTTQHGTKNLSKGAKSRVRVFADIQNFALCAHCVHGIPLHTHSCGKQEQVLDPTAQSK